MTSTHPPATAQGLRAELVEHLVRQGDLATAEWTDAFRAVARHLFVPAFWQRRVDGHGKHRWFPVHHTAGAEYLEAVYSDSSLVTQLDGDTITDQDGTPRSGTPTSSSTAPGLMARMLELLDVHAGARVLDAGTGTGYNAGLLSHRVGQGVVTVDIDSGVTGPARRRLDDAGYRPVVITGPAETPQLADNRFDRVIASYSPVSVPLPWIERTDTGGVIVVTLGGPLDGFALVRLVVTGGGRAEGHVVEDRDARFMASRPTLTHAAPAWRAVKEAAQPGAVRVTGIPADAWMDPEALFILGLAVPGARRFTTTEHGRTVTQIGHPDRSWAVFDHDSGTVSEGGPRCLGMALDLVHEQWRDAGAPPRRALAVEIDGGRQEVVTPTGRRWLLRDL